MRPRWSRSSSPTVPLGLHHLRHRQYVPNPLVLHDRPLVHFWEAVINGIGKGSAVRAQLDPAIRVLEYVDVIANKRTRGLAVLQQVITFRIAALGHAKPYASPGR